MNKELLEFIKAWDVDENGVKPLFLNICNTLEKIDGISLEYKGRPGISHSLRAKHQNQKNRPLFVLVDVIDDEPQARWLSICFYADLITDPEGLGDVVPQGLLGEDACCFDIDQPNEMAEFILEKVQQAAKNSAH